MKPTEQRKGQLRGELGNPRIAARVDLGDLREATIVSRPNRFVAIVKIGESEFRAHVADSGRLKELVYPGNLGMVREAADNSTLRGNAPVRSTSHDLVLASSGTGSDGSHRWVSIDTRYPNKVFGLALREGTIEAFREYTRVHREHYYVHVIPNTQEPEEKVQTWRSGMRRARAPRSRFDFMLLAEDQPPALVEVKSVTLCVDGVGLFPDAPTARGARHVRELTKSVGQGYRPFVVFIAQRDDVRVVRPNTDTDPGFASAVREAYEQGVGFLGYKCVVSPSEIVLDSLPVPVETV
jgi:sugar fermentation stimulation protein A